MVQGVNHWLRRKVSNHPDFILVRSGSAASTWICEVAAFPYWRSGEGAPCGLNGMSEAIVESPLLCERLRWVVYRQLREFLSLHGHYLISNGHNHNIENLPEFTLTSGYMR